MVFLYTFCQMIILHKHYTEITNILLQTFSIFPLFLLCRFFLMSGLYQIYKKKKNSLSCFRNWNCESNLKQAKNGPKKSTAMQKNIWKSFFYFVFWEQKKAYIWRKPEFELQRCFTAETKTRHYFLILIYIYIYIYIHDINYRTL